MLEWLGHSGAAHARKLRLFACACCRRIWHLLVDKRSRRAVEAAEWFADRSLRRHQLVAAEDAASDATGERRVFRSRARLAGAQAACIAAAHRAAYAAEQASDEVGWAVAAEMARQRRRAGLPEEEAATHWEERKCHCDLLRDMFGNPFAAPPRLDPAVLAGQVAMLAEAAYLERSLPAGHVDPARLAVLADALEAAGCTDAAVLGHLRAPGPHVRGCHVVDIILGRG
jgi:hypothetical protein